MTKIDPYGETRTEEVRLSLSGTERQREKEQVCSLGQRSGDSEESCLFDSDQ